MSITTETKSLSQNETAVLTEIISKVINQQHCPVHIGSVKTDTLTPVDVYAAILRLSNMGYIIECEPNYYQLGENGKTWFIDNVAAVTQKSEQLPWESA